MRAVALSLGLSAACGAEPSTDGPDSVRVSSNPNSALSVLATFKQHDARLARVISSDGAHTLVTPYFPVGPRGYGEVPVLGLSPSTRYTHVLELLTGSGPTTSGHVVVPTAALPDALAAWTVAVVPAAGAPPAEGYYLVSGAGHSAFAFDASGAIRWYRSFDAATSDSKLQEDGTFTTFVGGSTGWQPSEVGAFVRYSVNGVELSKIVAASPDPTEEGAPAVVTDPHELLIVREADGDELHHLLGYVQRPTSATDPTPASWHELLVQDAEGEVVSRWKSWSRFSADDVDPAVNPGPGDVDHPNAIAIDPADGTDVVSFRSFSAVVKVDVATGAVRWQLGGKQNQFKFVGDPWNGFQGQHSVQVLPGNRILLYDNGNGHDPPESRAVEYRLDTTAMTATMVWEHRHDPAIFTPVTGSVERLTGGDTLVAFAFAGLVDEVDRRGRLVWQASIALGAGAPKAYRVRRLPSLYAYAAP